MSEHQVYRHGAVARVLAGLVGGVCRRPKTTLLISGALVVLSLILTGTQLTYQTSRKDVLSPHSDSYKRWLHYTAEFGEDEDMVVVVQGDDRQQMENALDEVAARIAKAADRFDRLFWKVDL